jgi:ubiquitin carboxyl-terminal hydrolase 6/32
VLFNSGKFSCVSVTDLELKRLKEAFKRVSTLNGCITKQSFIKDVMGEGVPTPVAEVSLNFALLVC